MLYQPDFKASPDLAGSLQAKAGWKADLRLGFTARQGKTLLTERRHQGPLMVQRPFYSEDGVCHVYLLHPPGGVVGGDELTINVRAGARTHALITTPAAGKFYRSEELVAKQASVLDVEEGAALEWLPQETILFDRANVESSMQIRLAANARFFGWDILALGRPAAGEYFNNGRANFHWQMVVENKLLLQERLLLTPESVTASWGLNGAAACGTLLAWPVSAALLETVAETFADEPDFGVTRIGALLICRMASPQTWRIRTVFETIWKLVRPQMLARESSSPRIWAT
jgi:urease accessory protein